ncbi:hypothetical protein NE865_07199 [Phthorimaea operculella]|nr:hypothetical protein NE865_07199 [Phthorimaea operculella]
MVIRKSRSVKYRDSRKDSQGEKSEKIWSNSLMHGLPNALNSMNTPDPLEHDPNSAYRLQTLSAIASTLPPHLPHTTQPIMKPKKQDAIMQTDPIAAEDDDMSQPNNSYSETSDNSFNSEQLDYQKDYLNQQYKEKEYAAYQKEKDYPQYKDDKKYDDPKEYVSKSDSYASKSQDYASKSQDYADFPSKFQDLPPKADDYAPKPEDYTSKAESYTPKPQDYQPKPENYTPKSQDYIPKSDDYAPKAQNYAKPQDYTKQEDYIPQTNEEYNKEAEKYALERKSLANGYDKPATDYQKSDYQKSDYQKHDYQKAIENGYQIPPEYMGYSYQDSVEILRNQQHNLEMLQQQHRINENQNFFNENHIKQEIDLSSEEMYERAKDQLDANVVMYGSHRIHQQQRLLEHLQQQVKQEPDVAGCDSVLQPQGSPYYAPNGHTNGTGGYYEQRPGPELLIAKQNALAAHTQLCGYYEQRPGPELLIAKQNALAAHTQLWQNTMKRPFFYSETPPHYGALHRYEDLTRILQ